MKGLVLSWIAPMEEPYGGTVRILDPEHGLSFPNHRATENFAHAG